MEPMVALTPCERGHARNLDDGSCTTTRDTRELARAAGVYVAENDVIECEQKNEELAASTRLGRTGCIAREAPRPSCPARTVRTAGAGACAPLDHAGALDIASWSRAAAAEVCDRLSRSPLALERPEVETTITVELTASVPNNDLTQAFVTVRSKPSVPEPDLARAVGPLDDALRRLGGQEHQQATASEVTAAASCRTSSRRPISVP